MLNLLPVDGKKQLRKGYVMQLITIVLSGLIITLLIGSILLLPTFFLSKIKEKAATEKSLIVQESSNIHEEEALVDVLKEAKQKMDILEDRGESISLKEIVDTILIHRNSGIEVTNIFYAKSDVTVSLAVNGVAESREDLLTFSRTLEDDPLFLTIELPVSNLAKDRDISFRLTIHGDF